MTSLILLAVAMAVWPPAGWAQGPGGENPPSGGDLQGQEMVTPIAREELPSNGGVQAQGSGGENPPARVLHERERVPGAHEEPLSSQDAIVIDGTSSISGPEAQAGEIDVQAYSSPLVIPSADFNNDGWNPTGYTFVPNDGSMDGWANACMQAPAYLPDGATVTSVCATVDDSDVANNVTIDLYRGNVAGVAASIMATLTSAGAGGIQYPSDSTIVNPIVSYPTYFYYVTVCLPSANTLLFNVRIYYS